MFGEALPMWKVVTLQIRKLNFRSDFCRTTKKFFILQMLLFSNLLRREYWALFMGDVGGRGSVSIPLCIAVE